MKLIESRAFDEQEESSVRTEAMWCLYKIGAKDLRAVSLSPGRFPRLIRRADRQLIAARGFRKSGRHTRDHHQG
jgi:hypothetical protein